MSDFTKVKIGFAIALLAILFAISPIIEEYGSYGFNVYNVNINVLHLYTAFGIILFIAVYFYALNILTQRGIKYAQQIADILYAVAVIIPFLYLFLFVGISIISIIGDYIKVAVIITGLTIGVIAIGLFITAYLSKTMLNIIQKKEKASHIERYEEDIIHKITGAQGLLKNNHYNLSVIWCYDAVEKAIVLALYKNDFSHNKLLREKLINKAYEVGLIADVHKAKIDYIYNVRNKILRKKEDVNKEEAEKVLIETQSILSLIHKNNSM